MNLTPSILIPFWKDNFLSK